MSLLLIYQIENELKQNRTIEVAEQLGFKVKEVSIGEVHQKIGALVGLEGYELSKEPGDISRAPSHEMILFANTTQKMIQDFITALRMDNFVFPHKAALTETTKDWTFRMLVNHIEKENRVFKAYNRLGRDVKKALILLEETKDAELERIIEEARALYDLGEDLSERNVLAVQVKLDEAIKRLSK